MADYPMIFTANSKSAVGVGTSWTSTTGEDRSLECSIPKEFAGPSSGFSPEDLFLFALMNCYVATFKVIAANSKITFDSIEGSARLTLDRDPGLPTPWMKRADLGFTLYGADDQNKAFRLMDRVAKQCMIINSVKTEVSFKFSVVAK